MQLSRNRSVSPWFLVINLFVALACVAILGGAVWVQQAQGALPCALCVLQRMAYLGVLAFSLLAALGFGMRSPGLSRAALWLGLLAVLGGVIFAAKHVWLVYHPEQTCGLDPLATRINAWGVTALAPWLLRADGLCSDIPYLFGIPLPMLSGVGLLGLGVLMGASLPAARRLGSRR
ncbi:MAG: disulfide bond formation protein B [Betaproteobacteria bacterium]|nr:disulfide bond formation protein B [Betaproteobacteria bacterium]MBU6512934.1 disulfide bond formation protein B [Betaproteobacteria bacterium]MDE2153097.1 disulfide bond formation protein B [Betaproteobacteria bacterium]MDE2480183.1 disulfide bond formation protein B [Betaproteobacteria bacterium]